RGRAGGVVEVEAVAAGRLDLGVVVVVTGLVAAVAPGSGAAIIGRDAAEQTVAVVVAAGEGLAWLALPRVGGRRCVAARRGLRRGLTAATEQHDERDPS